MPKRISKQRYKIFVEKTKAEGRMDAFVFALKSQEDIAALQSEVVEKLLQEPTEMTPQMLRAPLRVSAKTPILKG